MTTELPLKLLASQDIGQAHLGCQHCFDRPVCGGLDIAAGGLMSCMDLCCGRPKTCDQVCPRNVVTFARRIQEVGGFTLASIPRSDDLPKVRLPSQVPHFPSTPAWDKVRVDGVVSIPFSKAILRDTNGNRAKTKSELRDTFRTIPSGGWLLCGIEEDQGVEKVWRLPNRQEAFVRLREAGVVFATTPNFSLYSSSPRHDNLHAIKRIGLIWRELVAAKIPTALHVNGRTQRDFRNWAAFLRDHPETSDIAFEFLTGAGRADLIETFMSRLAELRSDVARPLRLVYRGRKLLAEQLLNVFQELVLIDSDVYMKTIYRQRAKPDSASNSIIFRPAPTASPAQLASLFKKNMRHMHAAAARRPLSDSPQLSLPLTLQGNQGGDDDSRQMRFLFDGPSVNVTD